LITSTAELNTTRVYVQVLGQSKNLTTQIPYPIQSSVPVAYVSACPVHNL